MEKNSFIIFFCMLLAISYSQLSEQDSNLKSLRRLEDNETETVLIRFDNYSCTPNGNNFILNFNTYFLLKNWNLTEINDTKFQNINIDSYINYIPDNSLDGTAKFNCLFDENFLNNNCQNINESKIPSYCFVRYNCEYNSTGYPKKINLTSGFVEEIKLNKTPVSKISNSAQAIKRDITSLKINSTRFAVLENSTFETKKPNYFKIKGNIIENDFNFNNKPELTTTINGYPKRIPVVFDRETDKYNNLFYTLKTEDNQNLAKTELKYAVVNSSNNGEESILILDFAEGVNSTISPQINVKSKSKGLPTGVIVAILIPTILVLLAVTGLAYFILRKPITPQPVKNIGNSTIGVASTEAIVNQ